MNPMKMKCLLIAALIAGTALTSAAGDFGEVFADSTLRIDYVLGADHGRVQAYEYRQIRLPRWAGRRHHLAELPLQGNGTLRLRDPQTHATLYATSFSSLFQEWLSTPEASDATRAFEHTVLAPMPRREADIEFTLFDMRGDTLAHTVTRFRPDDILVASPSAPRHEVRRLHSGGDPSEAIDVVFLAEGYTPDEAEAFFAKAREATDEILGYDPYDSRRDRFNFTAIFTPSADSGVSVPKAGEWRDTPFGSHFSTFYSDRYLTTPRVWALNDAAAATPYEHIIVLANTDVYGGGGIYNDYMLTTANNPMFAPVVVHEFGHSFGGLADEYFYEGDVMDDSYPRDVEPWEPNITTLTDFDSKWKGLLKPGTPVPTDPKDASRYPVGVYEGGGYSFKGVYRPADECRMRNNTYPTFCGACRAALERLIDFYTAK